jgi:hypothetical protein
MMKMLKKVWQLVHTNQSMTIRMTAEELGMDRESVHQILITSLKTKKVCTETMHRILTTLAHTAVSERQFLMQKCTLLVEHPLISSPYLVMCDCSVLLTTKFLLKKCILCWGRCVTRMLANVAEKNSFMYCCQRVL